jgi:hypothetical protein
MFHSISFLKYELHLSEDRSGSFVSFLIKGVHSKRERE